MTEFGAGRLELSARALNALHMGGITTIRQARNLGLDGLLRLPHMGRQWAEEVWHSVSGPTTAWRLDREDYQIQIEAAARSVDRGQYAAAKAELRGAILILDTMERRDGR